jgi:hypothetical protein
LAEGSCIAPDSLAPQIGGNYAGVECQAVIGAPSQFVVRRRFVPFTTALLRHRDIRIPPRDERAFAVIDPKQASGDWPKATVLSGAGHPAPNVWRL